MQEEKLLRYYAAEWARYTTGANYINRLFTYLNRHWVKRERDEGRKTVYPIYTVSCARQYIHCASTNNTLACVGSMERQSFHAHTTKGHEVGKRNSPLDRTAT